MTSTMLPPFRADHVGSLLRSKRLQDARAKREKSAISARQLQEIEDEEIKLLIKKQEAVGLKAITDGEYRRAWWHYDFLGMLDGVSIQPSEQGIQFQGIQTKSVAPAVYGKISWPGAHPFIEHFKFIKENTGQTPKMMIPSPSMLYYRGTRSMLKGVYDDIDDYYRDMAEAFADCMKHFYYAGCRYLQLDDVSFAYLCDPKQIQMLRDRGDDPDEMRDRNVAMINHAIAQRPSDLTITMHLCRGNFRSTHVASGGYEPIAEHLFNQLDIDGYFLEWDNERSGGFEPLRLLPKGKRVVLGLITTKSGALETADNVKRRVDEAARYAPLDQLCLSPQCGFASTEDGNNLTEAEQWKKLELVVRLADEIWG